MKKLECKMFFIKERDGYGLPEVSKINNFKNYLKQWPYLNNLHPLTFQPFALRLILMIVRAEHSTSLKGYLNYIAKVFSLSLDQQRQEALYFCWYNKDQEDGTVIRIPPSLDTITPEFTFDEIDPVNTLEELKEINENRLQATEKILEDNQDNRYRINHFDCLKDNLLYSELEKIYADRIKEMENKIQEIKYFLAEIKKLLDELT